MQKPAAICFPRSLATAAPRLKDVWVKDAQQNITRFTQLGVGNRNGFNMARYAQGMSKVEFLVTVWWMLIF